MGQVCGGAGRGFLQALAALLCWTGLCGAAPLTFSVALPEGDYRVTVTLGDAARASSTTVQAENRRLMLEAVDVPAGESVTRSFLVNIHTPQISPNQRVRLKPREQGIARWDDRLSLEFGGTAPAVTRVDVAPAGAVTTIYIAGDSTVADQAEAPWAGWGQMLPRFFQPERVVVSNHAESGESLSSFLGERRMAKLLTTLRKGDVVLVQFGHNDMKQTGPTAGADKNYAQLLREYAATIRGRGATPVFITPMHRLSFDAEGKLSESLGDYPAAMRRVAAAEQVTLIDLNAKSRAMYEAVGPEKMRAAFVDETHSNEAAAYDFARLIAEAIRASDLPIAGEVVAELPPARVK